MRIVSVKKSNIKKMNESISTDSNNKKSIAEIRDIVNQWRLTRKKIKPLNYSFFDIDGGWCSWVEKPHKDCVLSGIYSKEEIEAYLELEDLLN